MCRVDTAVNELIEAIIDSEEYREYRHQLAVLKEHPDLKSRIDAFRQENFLLQQTEQSDEVFDKVDEFAMKAEELRKDPIMDSFLTAEAEFCHMIQQINQKIVEAVNFE